MSIVTVLEMHQFFWSACFTNGNGAPAWACEGHDYPDDRSTARCAPAASSSPAPWRPTAARCRSTSSTSGGWSRAAMPAIDASPDSIFSTSRTPIALRGRPGDGHPYCSTTSTAGCATPRRPRARRRRSFSSRRWCATSASPINDRAAWARRRVRAAPLYADRGLGRAQVQRRRQHHHRRLRAGDRRGAGFGGPLFVGEFGGNTNVDGGFRAATEPSCATAGRAGPPPDRRRDVGVLSLRQHVQRRRRRRQREGRSGRSSWRGRTRAASPAYRPRCSFDPTAKSSSSPGVSTPRTPAVVTELFLPYRHYPDGVTVVLPTGIALRFVSASQSALVMASAPGDYTTVARDRVDAVAAQIRHRGIRI